MGEQSGRTFRAAPTSMGTTAVVVAAAAWQALPASAASPAAISRTIVRGWGTNDHGALGTGSGALTILTPVRVKVPKSVSVSSIRAGGDPSVPVPSAGAEAAWGGKTKGQVGSR